ncbi:unnamed protein product [Euphydryas editha]|uniref:Regulatory protein zeste n=1 Tax=Euphydryas editha TaxID=104508 RepID=A0AAU9UD25_EUPED|nr:unnamed protein product [Euphydryas editha]
MEKENEVKKRSPNFTLEEKENLLSIVTKYKSIIENKKTGAFYIQKKKEAWATITKKYNSICTTGPRAEAMLKHLYNNMKHRARKVSASENKQKYIEEVLTDHNVQSAVAYENLPEGDSQLADDVEESLAPSTVNICDLKKKWIDEKKNIKKTGGGTFVPTLTDADHQILSILDDQIRPDENPYDEAAEYFGETVEVHVLNTDEEPISVPEPKPEPEPKSVAERTPKKVITFKKKRVIDLKPDCTKKSAEILKKIYFRKKIDLTFYQKKLKC